MIDVINGASFVLFVIGLALAAGAVVARVVRYSVQGWHRPRLLTRDFVGYGGLAITVGALLSARLMRALGVDVSGLSDNLAWAVITDVPGTVGVLTLAYYELFVIERAEADEPYREREHPHP